MTPKASVFYFVTLHMNDVTTRTHPRYILDKYNSMSQRTSNNYKLYIVEPTMLNTVLLTIVVAMLFPIFVLLSTDMTVIC